MLPDSKMLVSMAVFPFSYIKRIRSFMASYWPFSSCLACSKSTLVCSCSSCFTASSSSSVDNSTITFTNSASSALISPRSCSCCSSILLISPCLDFRLSSASFFFCSASDFLSAIATVNCDMPMAITRNTAISLFDLMQISFLNILLYKVIITSSLQDSN